MPHIRSSGGHSLGSITSASHACTLYTVKRMPLEIQATCGHLRRSLWHRVVINADVSLDLGVGRETCLQCGSACHR